MFPCGNDFQDGYFSDYETVLSVESAVFTGQLVGFEKKGDRFFFIANTMIMCYFLNQTSKQDEEGELCPVILNGAQ